MAPVEEAAPHFPSVDTGVHVPNPGWQRFDTPQKAGVLPQLPFTEQQFPNVVPLQVAPFAPHLPSVEVGRAAGVVVVGLELEVVDAVLFETVLLAVLVVEADVVVFVTGGGGT